jgi:hypothetical protein
MAVVHTFAVLDASLEAERRRWLEAWSTWPGREVQAHPAYLELYAGSGDRVRAALLESSEAKVLYAFIQRPVPADVGAPGWSDITSPYGYGGAFAWGHQDGVAEPFWAELASWAVANNVVAEFVRLSVGSSDLLRYPGTTQERLLNVIIATGVTPQDRWARYAHKVRKNVNKARAAGIQVVVDPTGERLDDFVRIYDATMTRRDAADTYRFPRSFFQRIVQTLEGQSLFFHALLEGKIISTELALISATRMYSFLGGTDDAHFELRPNDLLKHEMCEWAHSNGKSQFILGGGYSREDGIFRYKQSFAPDGVVPFFTGQRVFDSDTYERLCEAHGGDDEAFFPKYRAPRSSK